ncbi:pseudouridine synthase [Buchnera aphidicola]|uniref:Pseudouridine synthase n=1 Tax=Buchnera aphidicola (Cinara strobi) TaxID=1921549 RepID=A0A3B1DLD8_9GAMM|nr:pseudouridine synthase [Buchnera aphidicola]VAX76521.1 Ribosomal large subunit pseudouridine synthase B [Buchnera aphidicola (Cinara strobi)]
MKERIQKILSNYGLGSRRNIEKKICQGLIKINKKLVQPGELFLKKEIQCVYVDKKKIPLKQDTIKIILYHKPIGEICTKNDPLNRTTVFNKLPKLINSNWISVGRLDINTSGLLLFTNFGELAYRLMHPSYNIKREYLVRVFGIISKKMIFTLKKGIKINNSISKFHDIIYMYGKNKNKWFKVSLFQGKNKEIRLLWKYVGILVSRLIRISYGIIKLPQSLKTGNLLKLNSQYIKNVFYSVNLYYNKYIY